MSTSPPSPSRRNPVPDRPTELAGVVSGAPHHRMALIGRAQELERVQALLRRNDVPLVTLTGPGGIGKTRLALQLAAILAPGFPDGVHFIPLAAVRDPALIVSTVAHALRITDAPGQPLLPRLQGFLHDRHLLLVLDNLEHLLDGAAFLVADLLASCPNLTVLCTSRAPLGIRAEQVYPLGTLSPDEARTLFAVRAHAVEPAFAVTDELVPTVDAICSRLDQLPLAIELAAARINVLPPHALLARLERRLDLLTSGPRDAPARLRDMREAIAWSYELLPEEEQMLFCQLGVFIGGFTLEAVRAVAGDGSSDALAGISALVAASLVTPVQGVEDEPRFSMLETIREYALEQLVASGNETRTREAHLRHVVGLAEQAWGARSGTELDRALQQLRPETGNIQAALAWALEHEPVEAVRLAGSLDIYWNFSSSFGEGRDWIERSLDVTTALPPHIRARALTTLGWLVKEQHDLVRAEAYLTEAITIARAIGDEWLADMGLHHIGRIMISRGDLEAARRLNEELRARAVARGVPIDVALAMLSLGLIAKTMEDLPRAQELFEETLAISQALGGALGVAVSQLGLGEVVLARGDHARAGVLLRDAFYHFADLEDWANAARTLEGIAGVIVRNWPDRSTRLLAVAGAMRERVMRPRDSMETFSYESTVGEAGSLLGEEAFARWWEVGRSLVWDQVLNEMQSLATMDPEASAAPPPDPVRHHGLSPREREVLRLLAEGRSNRAIAEALSISERTVENHVLHILTKLDLESRTAAATWAVRHGLA